MLAAVYVPAVTAVVAKSITGVVPPVEVILPVVPDTLVTPPPPLPLALIVWLGQVPVMVTFVPCTNEGVDVPVPPLATGRIPVTPVVKGKPLAFVKVTDVGVPRTGVTSVGEIDSTLLPDPTLVVTPVPPLTTGRAVPE